MNLNDKPHTNSKKKNIEEECNNGIKSIIEATKCTSLLPSGSSRDAYCAYPTFGRIIDAQCQKILGIISKVIRHENMKGNIQRRQEDEQFEMILEYNDLVLERINSNLDEISGFKKEPESILVDSILTANDYKLIQNSGAWNASTLPTKSTRLIAAKNVKRPQISFKVPVDNNPNNPFIPKIKEKPNSLKPLAVLPEYDDYGNIISYLHPYEFEICKFEPSEEFISTKTVTAYKPLQETELLYIENQNQLTKCLEDLRNCTEIGVDLEHHSYRSFQGITCLMQISTKSKDYIIDTLKLREELHVLNEVFTNKNILKIFHGSDSDIEWLQRDLALYVVNMFDTHQAAKLLGFPRLSLAYLLKHYCNIDLNKTFQLADWRIRPLPKELITYAREDTHYLIYVYEMIRNELLEKSNGQLNLIKNVFVKSSEICKKIYVKPPIRADSHMDFYRRSKKIFDNRQLYALSKLFIWRDSIAREEDESCGYVIPNHMMLQIAESLPREMQGILACCNPIPPLIKQNLNIIHQIILKAREQPLVQPIVEERVSRIVPTSATDYNNKLNSQLDFSHEPEFRDDLVTLLGSNLENENNEKPNMKSTLSSPKLKVFLPSQQIYSSNIISEISMKQSVQFVSPYDRYKAVIPLIEKEKLEEIKRNKALDSAKLLCPIKVEKIEPTYDNDLEDDPYSLPLKESLKRKIKTDNSESSYAKKTKLNKSIAYPDEDNPKFNKINKGNKKEMQLQNTPIFKIDINKSNNNQSNNLNEPSTSKFRNRNSNNLNEPSTSKLRNRNKKKNKFGNKSGKNSNVCIQKAQNSSEQAKESIPFDYSKVNFKKFKGGAKSAQGKEMQPKFKGKGKMNKKNDKKLNKIFTFGNVNRKK